MSIRRILLSHGNPFVRKGFALALQAPRARRRLLAESSNENHCPAILCNSFPKSGTHLLLQILEAFPNVRRYGSFLNSLTSSYSMRERTERETIQEIQRIAPTEVLAAHLFYADAYQKELASKGVVHFFIMRDPRDVVISDAHYLGTLNKWHRLYPYFSSYESLEDRISLAIRGLDSHEPIPYPNVAERYSRYSGWRNNDSVCWVRYESLVSDDREKEVERVVQVYRQWVPEMPVKETVANAIASVSPQRSHTFREGGRGGWRKTFSNRLVDEMKSIAGGLLIELGYENDNDW